MRNSKISMPGCVRFLMLFFISFLFLNCNSSTEPEDTPNETEVYKNIIQTETHVTAVGFGNLFDSMFVTPQSREDFLRTYINFNMFLKDSTGYFYVNNYDGINIAHGVNLAMQGQDRSNVQDFTGKYYLRELLNNAKNNIYEFVTYHFLNPATGDTEPKYGYAEAIKSFGYSLASGFYVEKDDEYISDNDRNTIILESIVHTLAYGSGKIFAGTITNPEEQQRFLKLFALNNKFFPDNSGYIFVVDFNGLTIAHGGIKSQEGINVYDLKDTKGAYFIGDMINLAKNNGKGFVDYYYINPSTNKEEKKRTYIERIAGTDYFVGSGVYVDE